MDEDFEWDDDNVAHIDAHNVSPIEAEDAILDPRHVAGLAHGRFGEHRRAVIGATEAGRILFVVYIVVDNTMRVITAYDATERQKRQYRRGRK